MLLLVPTASEAGSLLDEPIRVGERPLPARVAGRTVRAALCGFGPAAAGVLATLALASERPRLAVLVGLAGTLRPDRLPVGGVLQASEVRSADVGRGRGALFVGPAALGIPQAPGGGDHGPVVDRLPLAAPGGRLPLTATGPLLTVASAAGSPAEAAERLLAHPDALAEDMEAFPVALACARMGVGLTVLRGVSNVAGAERSGWRIGEGLLAAREALRAWIRRVEDRS